MPGPVAEREDFDSVAAASNDSFPASDPPGWSSAHATPSAKTAVPEHTTRGVLKRIGIAVLAVGAMFSFVEGMRRVRTR